MLATQLPHGLPVCSSIFWCDHGALRDRCLRTHSRPTAALPSAYCLQGRRIGAALPMLGCKI